MCLDYYEYNPNDPSKYNGFSINGRPDTKEIEEHIEEIRENSNLPKDE
jgi:hypothetical protein